MVNTKVKSALVSSIILAMVACTNSVPNNSLTNNPLKSTQVENFQDLDKEYSFTTEALTQSYLKRKLKKWLGLPDDNCIVPTSITGPSAKIAIGGCYPGPVDGPKLVKEISYAKYKHPATFCAIVTEDPTILDAINAVTEVQDRRLFDVPFGAFLDDCTAFIPPPGPLGNEFQVNTTNQFSQHDSAIAMNSNGDFVVAWESGDRTGSQEGDQSGIYARRYNSLGAAQGPEFHVNTYITGQQRLPAVAIDDAGDFIITWESGSYFGDGPDGDRYGIFAQRYFNNGTVNGTEFQVNTYTINRQTSPSVAIDSNGDFVVTWQGNQDDTFYSNGQLYFAPGIYAQRYNSSGDKAGSEFQVNTYTTGNQTFPKVAMDSGGDFVVTWGSTGQDGDSGYGVFARRYDSNGVAKDGSEFRVNTYTTGNQNEPKVAMDNSGDFVISWQGQYQDGGDYGVFARRYDNNGVARDSSEFQVNTYTSGYQRRSSVGMDSSGDFVISWESAYHNTDNYYGVYAQRYNSFGVPQGSEFRVNTYTTERQKYSALAMDASGDFVVTWSSLEQDGNRYGIYGKRYDRNGVEQHP